MKIDSAYDREGFVEIDYGMGKKEVVAVMSKRNHTFKAVTEKR